MKRPGKETYSASLKEIFSMLFRHSKSIRILLPVEFLFLALDGFIMSRFPALVKYVVNGLEGGYLQFVEEKLLYTLLLGSGLAFSWYLAASIQHYLKERNSSSIMINIQVSLYQHLQNLSADFFQGTSLGEITSRLTNDIYLSVKELYQSLTNLFWMVSLIVPSLITMASYDVSFFLIFLAMMVLFGIVMAFLMPIIRRKQRYAQDQAGRINAKITENIHSIMLIKSVAGEKKSLNTVAKESQSFLKKTLEAARVRIFSYDFMVMLVGLLAPALILVFGMYMKLAISMIVAFYTYWFTTGTRLQMILMSIGRLFSGIASFDRVLEYFRKNPLVNDDEHAADLEMTKGEISLEELSFSYPMADTEKVLEDFSISLPTGTLTAIVGKSGAGKTSLFNLILRFYDPDAGRVKIDGVDIKTVKQSSLRSHISVVLQDTYLLNGSLRDNMRIVTTDADDKAIIGALEAACIWDFFLNEKDGLDTILGERGTSLSGGQRQRISIARALLKDSKILLLDEPTSAMDTETEAAVIESIQSNLQNRTALMITHRLPAIKSCGYVIVLEDGKLAGQGTHDELIKTCPAYGNLFALM